MKKVNRITANEDFASAIKHGKTISSRSFIVHFVETDRSFTRIGISVSKKMGHAIVRNRVKRQIRAMCDSLIDYASHTFDIVIVSRLDFLNLTYNENFKVLDSVMSKIGIK